MLDKLPLSGWKTWASAIGLILTGVGGFLTGNVECGEAIKLALAGLAVFGIGHKVEKAKAAAEKNS